MHAITLPWAFVFAFIPPSGYANGLLTFFVALALTGCVTVLIGDIAALFGCVIGMSDAVTAITFVALGTSLPDTFASKAAAVGDETADAAIGNVTGSNAVNVFLGLGLPWLLAAINWEGVDTDTSETWKERYGYYEDGGTEGKFVPGNDKNCPNCKQDYPEGGFIVPAGSLAISVIVFCCCAMCCFALLYYRRGAVGGELGGDPAKAKVHSIILGGLWFIYVGVSWYMDSNQ